jgi:mannitol 2-dehydrogenase
VSLTITNNGYLLNPTTGEFDADNPDVRADLGVSDCFATAWAYLAEALERRRRAGTAPFTVLGCDNIADNTQAAPDRAGVVRRVKRPRAGPLDRHTCRIPVDHGRPHHPADLELGAPVRRANIWRRRQVAGAD